MPKQLHIYAYGDVENIQVTEASEFGVVSLKGIAQQINSNPDAEEIIVHIHSRGGDVQEGFAIHDVLVNSGKKVITIVEGLCASIATVIALAGSVRKMTKNSEYFIHNPWTIGMGDAKQLQKTTDQVKAAEDKLAKFYNEKTGVEESRLREMMADETSMTTAQAIELKFVTEEIEEIATAGKRVKIYAKLPITNNEKPEDMKNKNKKAQDILAKVKSLISGSDIKNLDLEVEDGSTLHVETEAEEAAIGDVVSVDGKPTPDKEYKVKGGVVIKTDAESKISDIKKPDAETEEGGEEEAAATATPTAKEVSDLKAAVKKLTEENTALKADKKDLEDAAAETETVLDVIAKKVALLEKAAKGNKSTHTPADEETTFNKTSNKGKESGVSDAVQRLRDRTQARFKKEETTKK